MIEPIQTLSELLRSPATKWPEIASDRSMAAAELIRTAALLALIPALSRAGGLILRGSPNPYEAVSPLGIVSSAVATWLLFLLIPLIMTILLFRLSPVFGGKFDRNGAYLTVLYAALPTWLAGLVFVPFALSDAMALIVGLAGFSYLLYYGSRAVMSVPEDKAIGLVLVTAALWFIIYFALYVLLDSFMALRG
ncbi:MAG: Yip1 family protein [Parasphingopyxis sp.]|nr:YIP1 family protein [Sphingomonadales bacterium]